MVNIYGIIKNFADLERHTGNVTLKIPFAEFVEVLDSNYFRRVFCINHVVISNIQGTYTLLFDQIFCSLFGIVGDSCRSLDNVIHVKLFKYPFPRTFKCAILRCYCVTSKFMS